MSYTYHNVLSSEALDSQQAWHLYVVSPATSSLHTSVPRYCSAKLCLLHNVKQCPPLTVVRFVGTRQVRAQHLGPK